MIEYDSAAIIRRIAELREMTVAELREIYRVEFGEESQVKNKMWLWKTVAYRIQERKFGGLSRDALVRIEELGKNAPARFRALKASEPPPPPTPAPSKRKNGRTRDPRLPVAGEILVRRHAGREHRVTVLERGFEYDGERFRSLSAVATRIAKTRWNGYEFFGLKRKGDGEGR